METIYSVWKDGKFYGDGFGKDSVIKMVEGAGNFVTPVTSNPQSPYETFIDEDGVGWSIHQETNCTDEDFKEFEKVFD